MERYPLAAQRYIRTVIFFGAIAPLIALMWSGALVDLKLHVIGIILALVVSFGKVDVTGSRLRTRKDIASTVSLGFVPTFLMLVMQGPLAAMEAATVNIIITGLYPKRLFTHQILFNLSSIYLTILGAAVVLHPFGMAPMTSIASPLAFDLREPGTLIPYAGMALATGVYFLINSGMVAVVIALCSDFNIGKAWKEGFAWIWPSYLAGASCVAFVLLMLSNSSNQPVFSTAVVCLVGVPVLGLMILLHRYHWYNRTKQEEHIEELQKKQEALEKTNAELKRSQEQLQELFQSAVESLATAIDVKDQYTSEHIERVQELATAIGSEMGLSEDELRTLSTAALLHDIGKIAVPDQILTKPGALTLDEMKQIRKHPDMGAKILEPVNFPGPVVPAVRSHHERWDGTGYPDGLAGDAIPLGGRILAVADVFDALTTDRSYRTGWSEEEALEYVQSNAGKHFDPSVVKAFFAALERSPRLHRLDTPASRRKKRSHDEMADGISRASFEYYSLYEISQTISQTMNLSDTLSLLAVKIRTIFNASTCVLMLRDEEKRLRVERADGMFDQHFLDAQFRPKNGVISQVITSGEGVSGTFDASELETIWPWENVHTSSNGTRNGVEGHKKTPSLQSTLIAPLIADKEVIGTVHLYHERANAFDPEDLQVLCAVAHQAGRAIYNARQYDRTVKSAYTDVLTGLSNARYLEEFLDREVERAKSEQRPLTVLVLDLDNFKPVNDRFGHMAGNTVLRDMGQVLQEALRGGDLVARYAGDEFVIVLPSTGFVDAQIVIEKVRSAVTRYRPRDPDVELSQLRIGVSIGSATFPTDGTDGSALIASADRAMYRDKNHRKGVTLTAALVSVVEPAGQPVESSGK